MAQVRALATARLRAIEQGRVGTVAGEDTPAWTAHKELLASDVKRFLERPYDAMRPAVIPDVPPGAPIGDYGMDYLLGLDVCWVR